MKRYSDWQPTKQDRKFKKELHEFFAMFGVIAFIGMVYWFFWM